MAESLANHLSLASCSIQLFSFLAMLLLQFLARLMMCEPGILRAVSLKCCQLPSPSSRSQSKPGATNWLAYQFIISFNKVDIQPLLRTVEDFWFCCLLAFLCVCLWPSGSWSARRILGLEVGLAKVLNLSRLAFWHFSLAWNWLVPSSRRGGTGNQLGVV